VAGDAKSKQSGLGGLKASGTEAVQLVIDYLKQETLDPLKGLGRFILWGVVGSVALSAGLVILTVAVLRLLQGETGSTFTGHLSWLPYLICVGGVILVAVLAVAAIVRGRRRTPTPKEQR
jgi:peptidoglycan biosynthesis protein MviN/MurJ (putative lipid II flippase)